MEHYLQSPEEKSIGTVKEVIDALLAKFPGSEQIGSRMIDVVADGEHIGEIHIQSPVDDDEEDDLDEDFDDLENPEVLAAPVTWFTILGDSECTVVNFLSDSYGVEPQST